MISAAKLGEYARRALYISIYGVFAMLPMEKASALGGWIARAIGPRLRVNKLARRNIERALPDESPKDVDDILHEMWDNLGRVVGEFPHIGRLDIYNDPRIEVVGREYIDTLRDDGRPGLFITPHIGNWELSGYAIVQRGFLKDTAVVYRAPNDPAAEWLLQISRKNLEMDLIPKGSAGARRIVQLLRAGGHVCILPDQKMNDGIAVPFFGRPAMTAPAAAQLALKFGCAIVTGRVVRRDGARFRMIIDPPMQLPNSGDRHADVLALTATLNQVMETYIREHPGQWLWVHKRWPD